MRSRSSAAKKVTTEEPKAVEPEVPPKSEPVVKKSAPAEESPEVDDFTLGAGYDRIVDTVFSIDDPHTVYEELEKWLSGLKPSRADYGTLVDALDDAQAKASLAMQLLVNAKCVRDTYEIDAKVLLSGMRDQATAILQEQKNKGERSKQITDGDVESVMGAKFPDEWKRIADGVAKAKRTVDYLEDLAERSRERARDIRAMVTRSRDG